MKTSLGEDDLARIQERIRHAEEKTSGEIVPYVVARSDSYEVVVWRGAAATATAFLFTTLLIYLFYQGWGLGWLYSGIGLAVGMVASFVVGVALVQFVAPVFRFIAGSRLLTTRVRARAERAFIEEGVFRTEGRTGILILVSMWERRIVVLADEGISETVAGEAWETVVQAARVELRRGDLAEALIAAVDACGEILLSSGLKSSRDKDGDGTNELGDELRFGSK